MLSESGPPPLTTSPHLSPSDHGRLSLSATYAPAAAPEKANPGATRNGEEALRDPRPLARGQGRPRSPPPPWGPTTGSGDPLRPPPPLAHSLTGSRSPARPPPPSRARLGRPTQPWQDPVQGRVGRRRYITDLMGVRAAPAETETEARAVGGGPATAGAAPPAHLPAGASAWGGRGARGPECGAVRRAPRLPVSGPSGPGSLPPARSSPQPPPPAPGQSGSGEGPSGGSRRSQRGWARPQLRLLIGPTSNQTPGNRKPPSGLFSSLLTLSRSPARPPTLHLRGAHSAPYLLLSTGRGEGAAGVETLWGSSAGACAQSPGLGQEGLPRVPARGRRWRVGLGLGLGRGLILRRRVTGQKKLAEEQTVHRAYWPEILMRGLSQPPHTLPALPLTEETSGNPWKVLGFLRGGRWRPLAGAPRPPRPRG